MAVTARTLVTDALIEVGICGESQSPSGPDAARALRILSRDILEPWSVQKIFAWTRVFTQAVCPADEASQGIGPTGLFVLAIRPAEVFSVSFVDTASAPDIYRELNLRGPEWFAGLAQPGFTSTQPTDAYYAPGVPDGTLYLWPIPTSDATIQVETNAALTVVTSLDTSMDFAPAYESAVLLTLKEFCYPAWHRPTPPELVAQARRARTVIGINNLSGPRRLISDAPSLIESNGSDSIGFRTRQF